MPVAEGARRDNAKCLSTWEQEQSESCEMKKGKGRALALRAGKMMGCGKMCDAAVRMPPLPGPL